MNQRYRISLLTIAVIAAAITVSLAILNRPAEAQSGPTRMVGAIPITADTFDDLGNGWTRATGNIRLGPYFLLAGRDAYIVFDRSTLRGSGVLTLQASGFGGSSTQLFSGSFHADSSAAAQGMISPDADAVYRLNKVAGFAIEHSLALSQIHIPSGVSSGTAILALPARSSAATKTPYGPLPAAADSPATAGADFTLAPGANGPSYSGTLAPFELLLGGLALKVPGGMALDDGSIAVPQATLGSEALFGSSTTSVKGVLISPQSVKLASSLDSIDLPDICFGSPRPCPDNKIRISGITARLSGGVFVAEGVLNINLPSNKQNIRIQFTTSDENGGGLAGKVEQIDLKLAGSTLTLQQITLSASGLSVDKASLALPASLGNTAVAVNQVSITSSGLSVGGGSITLPTIKIGDGTRLQIQEPTATIAIATDQGQQVYTFGLSARLLLNLPQNNQTINISAEINQRGELRATIARITLNLATAQLELNNLTLNNTSLSAGSASLTLPASLGGASGAVSNVVIDRNGLRIGGGTVNVPIPSFRIGGASGFAVTGASLGFTIAADQSFEISLNGTVTITIPGSRSASATGTITVDRQGNISGQVSGFSVEFAGMNLAISEARLNGDTFSAVSASLRLPASFGGAAAAVYNVSIGPGRFSIGGGRFTLPTMNVGGFTIQASGELRPLTSGGRVTGYEISASGGFTIPNMPPGGGCSGIQASFTIAFDAATGMTIMTIQPLEEAIAQSNAALREALRAGDQEGVNAELQALRRLRVAVELSCAIPIPQTGHAVTGLRGSFELNEGTVRISVGLTIATQLSLPVLGPPLRGTADAYIQANPFEIGLSGSIYVFIFQVGGADMKISERDGFRATLWIQMVWGRGDLTLRAWSSYGRFYLTGRATIEVGFNKGQIWRGCLKHPCCRGWCDGCHVRVFGKCIVPRCGVSCSLCDGPCVDVPPWDLRLGRIGAEFGAFTGDRWGFKGFVSVNFFGKDFGTGFFIDYRGNLTVGNVDNIRLVTSAQIAAARQEWLAAQASGANVAGWQKDGIGFLQNNDVRVSVPVTTTTDVIFALSRNRATPNLTLQTPGGVTVDRNNLPANIQYGEVVTYTLAPATQQASQLLAGLAPEVASAIRINPTYNPEAAPALIAACQDQQTNLAAIVQANLGGAPQAAEGRIRLLNAAADQALVDMLVDDELFQGQVPFGITGPYDFRPAGARVIKVVPAGKTAPVLATTTLVLGSGAYHTLALSGSQGSYQLTTLTDNATDPAIGRARMRFAHVLPGVGAVDVAQVNGPLLYTQVAFGSDGGYLDMEPGTFDLEVRAAGTENVLLRVTGFTLGDGDVATVYAMANTSLQQIYLPIVRGSKPAVSLAAIGSRAAAPQATAAARLVKINELVPRANIRIVHATRGVAGLDGTLGGFRTFANVAFKQTSAYMGYDPGQVAVQILPAGKITPVYLDAALQLARRTDYTLVALPSKPGTLDRLLLTDDNNFPTVGNSKVRFVHVDVNAPAVDVVAISGGASTFLARNLSYKQAGAYVLLPGGAYTLELRAAGAGTVVHRLSNVTLKEGNVYTLFAFDADTAAAAGSQLVINTDIESEKYIQEMFIVNPAETGTWQMIVNDPAGTQGQPGDQNANYLLQVLGSNPAPAISEPRASRSGDQVTVSWKLTSQEASTPVNVFVTTGPITATQTVTDTQGVPRTFIVPVYSGERVAGPIASAVDGSLQSTTFTLQNSETGRYYVWLEADDGRNMPTRAYTRRPAAAVTSDTNPQGEATIQVEDLEAFDVDQPWNPSWNAALQATPVYGGLSLSWNPNASPDVDGYRLRVSGPGITGTKVISVGKALSAVAGVEKGTYTIGTLIPGESYTLQVEAYDEEGGKSALSEQIVAQPGTAPFELSGPASLGAIRKQPISAQLSLGTALSPYPDLVTLRATAVPDGLGVSFSKVNDPTCGVISSDPALFCPSVAGTGVTMSISTTGMLRTGSYNITVEASGGGVTRSLTLPINVEGANFSLAVNRSALTLTMPNGAAGQTEGPPADVAVTLNGFNDASDPVKLEVWSLPAGVDVTFWRDGVQLSNPTIIAGQTVTARFTTRLQPPQSRTPANNDAQLTLRDAQVWIVGFSRGGYWNYSDPISISTANPNPVIERQSNPTPRKWEIFGKEVGSPLSGSTTTPTMVVQVEVPAGGPYILRAVTASLPLSTTVAFRIQGSGATPTAQLALSTPGTVVVEAIATIADGPGTNDIPDGWYYFNIEAVNASGTVLYTLVTDFGIDIPDIDFDTDPDNYQIQPVFPGATVTYDINVNVPAGWTTPVSVTLETDYMNLDAFSALTLAEVAGASVPGTGVLNLSAGTGAKTVRVTATAAADAEGAEVIWVNLRSGPVWNETRLYAVIELDFDPSDDNFQDMVADGPQTYRTFTITVPLAWDQPVLLAVDEDYLDPAIGVAMKLIGSDDPYTKSLTLPGPGTYQIEVEVTSGANTPDGEYWFYINQYDPADEPPRLWLNYTEFRFVVGTTN